MKVTKEVLDNCEALMVVEIDDRQKQKLLQKAAKRIAKEAKIPGFRPGKAPYNYILNRFGVEAIQEEAMEDLTQDIFQKALEEAEITPYAMAALDSIEWEPLVMKVKVPLEPVIELGDYRDIRLEAAEPEVTDEEIAERFESMREQYATFSSVDRAAEMGDMVSFTVTEKIVETGEVVVDADEREQALEAQEEGSLVPDFSAELVSLAADDEKTFTHTYSDEFFREEVAGKEVEITATVSEVKEKEEVELDDDFASLVGDYDTLDDLKVQVTSELATQKQQEIDGKLGDDMMEKIIESAEIKWPAAVEEQELNQTVDNLRGQLTQAGLDLESYLKTQQKTVEEYREEQREAVQDELRRSLVLGKIVELENLQVDPNELRQRAEMMVMMYGGSKEAVEMFTSPAGMQMLANNVLMDKARQQLIAIAKGEVEAEEAAAAEAAAKAAEEAAKAEAEAEAAESAESESEIEEVEAEVVEEVVAEVEEDAEADVEEDK